MVLYDENINYIGQKKTINIDNHIENMDVVIYKIDSEGVEKQVTIL